MGSRHSENLARWSLSRLGCFTELNSPNDFNSEVAATFSSCAIGFKWSFS